MFLESLMGGLNQKLTGVLDAEVITTRGTLSAITQAAQARQAN